MRDMKGERIEPRIGNEGFDPVADKPARRNRADDSGRTSRKESGVEARVVRDVLMDSPTSRYVAPDLPVVRTELPTKRERGYSKVSPQGQRTEGNRQRKVRAASLDTPKWNFSWVNRKLGAGLLVLGILLGGYWVSEPVAKIFERPIKSVVVEGDFNFISKQRATELIGNEINGDFLQLDLMQLKNALLNDPWVEKVTLNRRWPDTLVVKITEQKPIARWGNGFLNQRGEIVRIEDASQLSGLPWLQGNEADAPEILQQYQDLSQILRSRGLEVIALKCDNKKSWRLTIKNHVEIALGRDQVMEKIRRFVTVYDTHLSNVWMDVKAIDARYTNGVSVRWVADSAMAKKYIKSPALEKLPAPSILATPKI
ncbi:cell division protein FtsQ/DivIB [Cellvibrio sp. pealriver]|uniref:cell division protein FtsQ/DivIB n=1 Tax=Cellvibrio sp. pealriver TaxID=1622269 RepID=UPI00066FEBAB|nr:cell division protein FtsQ/DivIB [Cellvibrio sp. pealriver]